MGLSVATISSPEFINLKPLDINPLISECEIKVLYVGQNRNRSYITKEVATEISKTLRGTPIVGAYSREKEDFTDHGERITIDSNGIKFECLTIPYGFVSPNAKVWFQEFEDTDDFGNSTLREYLMTQGYLWTGQFEECKLAVEENGRPHSMEFDKDSLEGKWAEDSKTNLEFFIINDAIFSKLCILGTDVEPCFEGSSVTAPEVSKNFTKENKFNLTLFSMMQELKTVLEGGQNMAVVSTEGNLVEINFSNEQDKVNQPVSPENQISTEGPVGESAYSKTEEEEDKKEKKVSTEGENNINKEEEEDKNKNKVSSKHSFEKDYEELKAQYTALKENYDQLVEFKNQIEDKEKDELIKSFYMLSEEDKKEIIENKAKYSLDEIEAKLSVICVRKKVNFNLEEDKDAAPAVTFNLNSSENNDSSVPDWVSAIRRTKNNRSI